MGRMKIAGAENRRLESGDLVVLSTDFSSSSVDVARPRCEGRWPGLLVGPGDLRAALWHFAVLRFGSCDQRECYRHR